MTSSSQLQMEILIKVTNPDLDDQELEYVMRNLQKTLFKLQGVEQVERIQDPTFVDDEHKGGSYLTNILKLEAERNVNLEELNNAASKHTDGKHEITTSDDATEQTVTNSNKPLPESGARKY